MPTNLERSQLWEVDDLSVAPTVVYVHPSSSRSAQWAMTRSAGFASLQFSSLRPQKGVRGVPYAAALRQGQLGRSLR